MGRKSNYEKRRELKKVKVEFYLSDGVDLGSYTDKEFDAEFMNYIDEDLDDMGDVENAKKKDGNFA